MLKKLHSNRDPKETLFSEIHREFRPYFGVAFAFFRSTLERHPRLVFGLMVSVLFVSLVLSFTVFRHPAAVSVEVPPATVNPVQDGFSRIIQATGELRQTIRLKQLVDSLTAKKNLSAADSTVLDSALSQLQRINTIKNN